MKKYVHPAILIFLCLLTACLTWLRPSAVFHAQAEELPQTGSYACILQENTYFCASANDERLFALPQSYYVRLLEYGKSYCRVEYLSDGAKTKKLVGYVRTQDLTFVPYVPVKPYPTYIFELSYRIDEEGSASSDFLNEITVSCAYYGDYLLDGKSYCYVLRGESFGYVPKPKTLSIPENGEYAEYLASKEPSTPTVAEPTEGEGTSPTQIAILVALCLLVPVLAALILKPPRRPPYDLDG